MNEPRLVATIFFKVPLARGAVSERDRLYNSGITFIETRFPELEIVRRLPDTFAMVVRGDNELIRAVREAVGEHLLGTLSLDNVTSSVFRGAARW